MQHSTFSTASLPPELQCGYWSDSVQAFFGNLQTELLGTDTNFSASLIVYQLGDLDVFRVIAPAHRVWSMPSETPVHISDCYKLVLQVKGHAVIEQEGKSIILYPGEWSIYDPRLNYSITNHEPMEALVILVPRHPLRNFRLTEVQCHVSGRSDLDSMQEFFSGYLYSLSAQLPHLPDSTANTIAETTIGLLISTLAIRQAEKDLQRGSPDVMRVRVKGYINSHLDDPALSIDQIAHDMNCSKRYLHRIFEDEGVTLDRYIWNARLERCRVALESERDAPGSISRIAFAWGFNSNAHFCRLFKSRLGVSPREYQLAARNARFGAIQENAS